MRCPMLRMGGEAFWQRSAAKGALRVCDRGFRRLPFTKTRFFAILRHMNRRDYIYMAIISILFAAVVFFRLGAPTAPEHAYVATAAEGDIVLDLGRDMPISHVLLFLGPLDNRYFSLSAYGDDSQSWVLLQENVNASSVFTWNRIDVAYTLRYLGLVTTADETIINEMVIVSADGTRIVPRNAGDYPGLFDEQNSFVEYATTYYGGMMFDEIYHGRTAYEFIHSLRAYENTHPHLGKSIISLGIRLFGMNPFGWRFMSAIFGILMLPLIYLLGKKLFDSTTAAVAATLILAADSMHFALSRIATIDIFAAFFILLMYYFMLCYIKTDRLGARFDKLAIPRSWLPLALCGIAMGLGFATKWTAIYAGAGLALIFLWYLINHYPKNLGRLLLFCLGFFVFVPLLIYVLSFIPYGSDQGLIHTAIDSSRHMLSYHADLLAQHYYGTPFHDWPILKMPLLYATDIVDDAVINIGIFGPGQGDGILTSSVSCMGNPFIWWTGIPCIFFCIYRFLIKKDRRAGFLVTAYLAQYLPWFFVSRLTFIYHYFPAALFMFLMIAHCLELLRQRFTWGRWVVYGYLSAAVAIFFVFYPVTSGIPASRDYQFSLRWLTDWILVL